MSTTIIIPARMESVRLAGKPLLDINGQTLIARVWRQAVAAVQEGWRVYVATDHPAIRDEIVSLGGNVAMTGSCCRNGTERCAQALDSIPGDDRDIIVNLQGDLPFIEPATLRDVVDRMTIANYRLLTIMSPATEIDRLDPNTVKVATGKYMQTLFFSRGEFPQSIALWRHAGVYVFRREVLKKYPSLIIGTWEHAESLEQMRWLEHGFEMFGLPVSSAGVGMEVNTPADLAAARAIAAGKK